MRNFNFIVVTLCMMFFEHTIEGEPQHFPFHPSRAITLEPSDILVSHPVTTQNRQAQLFFDQGLTLYYAFNHDASFWSFQKAAEIDPNMAMAYWGMALAIGPNINMKITPAREDSAYKEIQKALKLVDLVSENEKDYIQALALRYSADPKADKAKMSQNYSDAMKALMKKYPDDLDASVLYAESGMDLNPWNQWTTTGEPLGNTLEIISVLETVLKREPNNLGANHFYIHVIESSNHPERGLMSAYRLINISPTLGHLLHMPAHIFILVGDYHLASLCNEEAIASDKAYIKQYGLEGMYPVHYLSHNFYFLSRSYSMEGRFKDAFRVAEELKAFYEPDFEEDPDLAYYISTSLFTLMRFHQWEDIIALGAPNPKMKVTTILWHFGRAMAFTALGNQEKADEEKRIFLEGKSNLPSDVIYGYNKAGKILLIAQYMLDAKTAEMQKKPSDAIDYLERAIGVQDTLHYNEPPDWFFSVRESLGGMLLREKRFTEAERVFRDDLAKHPRNGRSLFGLMESLKAQARSTDADWVERAYKQAWRYSDTQLSVSNL